MRILHIDLIPFHFGLSLTEPRKRAKLGEKGQVENKFPNFIIILEMYCFKYITELNTILWNIYWKQELWSQGKVLQTRSLLGNAVCTSLLGSGFQRRTFPFLWVPELSPASATIFSTDCLPAVSLSTQTLGLSANGCCPSLYSLDTDRTENTASNSSSIVSCMPVVAITWRLLSHCLAMGVFAEPLPSNGCLCYLHSSGNKWLSQTYTEGANTLHACSYLSAWKQTSKKILRTFLPHTSQTFTEICLCRAVLIARVYANWQVF
jgi:hypothetical protein